MNEINVAERDMLGNTRALSTVARTCDSLEERPPSVIRSLRGGMIDLRARARDLRSLKRWRDRDPEISAGRVEKAEQRARRAANEDPDSTEEFARRAAAKAAGVDPDTGEMLEDVRLSGSESSTEKSDTRRCSMALRYRVVKSGLEGVRWTRCGKRACPQCGPKRIEEYERDLLASVPDVDLLHRFEVDEAEWSSVQRRLSRERKRTGGGYVRIPIDGQGRFLVATDLDIGRGELVETGDLLIAAGETLDQLHSDAEAMKGKRVDYGGEWKERKKEDRSRRADAKAELQGDVAEVEYLGPVNAKNAEHVAEVAASLKAKAVPVARRGQAVEDAEGRLIVGDVVVTGLTPLTVQVFWKRLGFRSFGDLAADRMVRQLEREIQSGYQARMIARRDAGINAQDPVAA